MILIRHGESHFNLHYARTRVDPGIRDPELTPAGQAQALAAAAALSDAGLSAIVTSPYTRALQTASILAEALGLPIEVDPLVGERGAMSCDVGSPASELSIRWPRIDLSRLGETWWPEPEEPQAGIERRAAEFLAIAGARPDRDRLLVVSHWGFIRAVTGRELHNCATVRLDWRALSAHRDPC